MIAKSSCSDLHALWEAACYGKYATHTVTRVPLMLLDRKIPWRLSAMQKARQRKRLRLVDKVVDTLSNALAKQGKTTRAIERWYAEMPREEEMLPKDKYTIFDRKEKKYRKGIHSKSKP